MRVDTDEPEIIERVAALDVAKAEVVCCARVPGAGRQRMQEVRAVSTMTAALLGLGDWLAELGVTRVVMEATSDYWRGPAPPRGGPPPAQAGPGPPAHRPPPRRPPPRPP